MDSNIFFGGSVIAAFVGGSIALFAPCCISVMLPAYLASYLKNRSLFAVMTLLFTAGVATIILPIAMGAAVIRQLIMAEHTLIYVTGGLLMMALGAYMLLGGQIHLPMPEQRPVGKAGPLSTYLLGFFSGITSTCCAPVIAGLITLSGIASSFGFSLILGTAYVVGMVAPLFIIAMLWERYNWRSSRLFRPRTFTWRLGPLRRTITGSSLASGLLLAFIGIPMVWVGLAGDPMPTPSGWQAAIAVRMQRFGQMVTESLSWVPNWAAAGALLVFIAFVIRKALRQMNKDVKLEDQSASKQSGRKDL